MTGQKKDMAGEDRLDAEQQEDRAGKQEDRLEAELVPVNDHDVIVMSR